MGDDQPGGDASLTVRQPAVASPTLREPPPAVTPSPGLPGVSLLIRWSGHPPRTYPVDKQCLTIGRALDNGLVLNCPIVSGHHARLDFRNGVYQITDLRSTNGTAVNGLRIAPEQPHPLVNGDVVRIGDPQGNSISLTYQDERSQSPDRHTMMVNTSMFATVGIISLILGRDPQCQIPLPSPQVSRQHARLDRGPQGDVLTDLNSTNSTFVNGQRITSRQLQPGDIIQIGPFRLSYTAAGLAPSAQVGLVRLDARNLSREVQDRKTGKPKLILNDVTFSIQPGEFVAVVGGSGAGKSTLMKALNGQVRATSGQVLLNGDDFYARFDQYRSMIGYVPQQDIVHRDLTVESALRYAARLRLPPDMQPREIERRIDDALERLDILDKKKDAVSTLSGGQLKRVNIAVEMLADPDLFFLDEPSSGLDPGTEKKLMYDMQRVSDSGKTVILITHATDNVGLCDHVVFLGYGGKLVFFGPPQEALAFFQAESFADIYLKLNKPVDVDRWQQQFSSSPLHQQYVQKRIVSQMQPLVPSEKTKAPRLGLIGNLRQFLILTQRYFELVSRSKFSLFILLAVMPIIGLMMLLVAKPFWLTGKYDPVCEKAGIVSNAVGWKDDPGVVERCIDYRLRQDMLPKEVCQDAGVVEADGWDSLDAVVACEQYLEQNDIARNPNASYVVANRAQTLLFIMAFACVLLGIFGAAFELIKEQAIFLRERMINLSLWPYLMSKFVVLGGFSFVQGFSLLLVIGLGVRLPEHSLFLPAAVELYISLLLAIWASIALGLWISSFADQNSAVYIILPILIIHIIFAGAFFDLNEVTEVISYATITRWSLNAMGASTQLNTLNELSQSRVIPDIEQEMSLTQDVPELGKTQTITYTVPLGAGPIACNCAITDTEALPPPVALPPDQMATCVCLTTELIETSRTVTETMAYTTPLDSKSQFDFQLGFECTDLVTQTASDGQVEQVAVLDKACTQRRLFQNWGILLGFTVGFHVLAAITLKIKERRTYYSLAEKDLDFTK
ncbi:MAG: FHA domain-containing protein [Anaerolineae bacterium]|nr:FHA domain-containing protein [Anaerolineae bacterium]